MRSVPGHGEIRRAAFGATPVRRAAGFSSSRWYRFRWRSGRCRAQYARAGAAVMRRRAASRRPPRRALFIGQPRRL
ncbi:hypothetical protein C6P79_10965 [Burkholderia multivorans]|nr:hypothetical protein C6P79_10965 [Burkholderia multivorans]